MALSATRDGLGCGGDRLPRWRRLALALGCTIAGFGIAGLLSADSAEAGGGLRRLFDLDRELNLSTAFSAGLLAACGIASWRIAARSPQVRVAFRTLGVFFVFMASDEALKVHETLEKWSGIDWQLLYLPLALVVAPPWLMAFLRADRTGKRLWVAGAAAWVASQGLEAMQWTAGDEKVASYRPMMLAEELLEMAGSSLFLLALYRGVRALRAGR